MSAATRSHRRRARLRADDGRWLPRLEQDHADARQVAQRTLDARLDLFPRQPPESRAQRRQRDRAYAAPLDLRNQGHESRIDILEARLAAPVPLRGEIDDEPRVGQLPGLEHEHPARPHLLALAGSGVGMEVRRPRLLELQRHAAAHVADAIDRIDESFGVGRQPSPFDSINAVPPHQ
jgi:hypothetical protein